MTKDYLHDIMVELIITLSGILFWKWSESTMKKFNRKKISIIIATIFILGIIIYLGRGLFNDYECPREYIITGTTIDLNAANIFPQEITVMGNYYKLYHHGSIESIDEYPIAKNDNEMFVLPSSFIESNDNAFNELAEELFADCTTDQEKAIAALEFTSSTIKYDRELAKEIMKGSFGKSALQTLNSGTGTCSEYANVFIALMRNQNIPARIAIGVIYNKSYHAWAEIYINNRWIAVDPQMGEFHITNMHIKLFDGMDYPDVGVPLEDIDIKIK